MDAFQQEECGQLSAGKSAQTSNGKSAPGDGKTAVLFPDQMERKCDGHSAGFWSMPSDVNPLPHTEVFASSAAKGISFMCVMLPLIPSVPPKFISAVHCKPCGHQREIVQNAEDESAKE